MAKTTRMAIVSIPQMFGSHKFLVSPLDIKKKKKQIKNINRIEQL